MEVVLTWSPIAKCTLISVPDFAVYFARSPPISGEGEAGRSPDPFGGTLPGVAGKRAGPLRGGQQARWVDLPADSRLAGRRLEMKAGERSGEGAPIVSQSPEIDAASQGGPPTVRLGVSSSNLA